MKYITSFLIILVLTLNMPSDIFAEQENSLTSETAYENQTTEKLPKLYPVSVYESNENGTRKVIKTYELLEDEKPEDIPCDDFEQGSLTYTLSDIVKKESSSIDVKEHTKTVSLNTDTNDVNAIVKQLAPTIEYKSDDGYMGILNLDISSIKIKTGGTKTDNFTISSVREYPGLSSNDSTLIPKTITENGKTMNISGIEWKVHTSSSVDYNELPSIYTAVATYTATVSKTAVTGYSVTAEYKGSISKAIQGKTIYTAIFNEKLPVNDYIEEDLISFENVKGDDGENEKTSGTFIFFVVLFSVLGGIIGFIVLFLIKRRENRAYDESIIDDEYPQISENDE